MAEDNSVEGSKVQYNSSRSESDTGEGNIVNGKELDEIIGVISAPTGEILFLVKWKNDDSPAIVLAPELNAACPQFVIAFYERHVMFAKEMPLPEQNQLEPWGPDEDGSRQM